MPILPKQTGVALGLSAFALASLISIFFGAPLEIGILRGGISFFIFLIIGWLVGYLVYEEEKQEIENFEVAPEKIIKVQEEPVREQETEEEIIDDDFETRDLKPPDDSDF